MPSISPMTPSADPLLNLPTFCHRAIMSLPPSMPLFSPSSPSHGNSSLIHRTPSLIPATPKLIRTSPPALIHATPNITLTPKCRHHLVPSISVHRTRLPPLIPCSRVHPQRPGLSAVTATIPPASLYIQISKRPSRRPRMTFWNCPHSILIAALLSLVSLPLMYRRYLGRRYQGRRHRHGGKEITRSRKAIYKFIGL
jgi:hypothetical protein